jgi:hypothetical protein
MFEHGNDRVAAFLVMRTSQHVRVPKQSSASDVAGDYN